MLEKQRAGRARDRLAQHIANARHVEIRPYGKDRFNRPLIYLLIDGTDIAHMAITEGWDVPYEGGRKPKLGDPKLRFETGA